MKTITGCFALFFLLGCQFKEELQKRAELYPNNQLRREYYLKKVPNGEPVRHGPYREYYSSGSNKESSTWKDGLLDGYATAWHVNGKEKWEKRFKGGLRTGTWRLSYSEGYPAVAVAFSHGLPEGDFFHWDRLDTVVAHSATYKAGNCVSGDCTFFDLLLNSADLPESIKGRGRDSSMFAEFFHSSPGQEPEIEATLPVQRGS